MASYSYVVAETSVKITVTGIKSGNQVRFYIRYEPHTGVEVVDSTYNASNISMEKTFRLTSGTSYAVNVCVIDGDSNAWLGTSYFTTPSSRPENWSWWSSIGSGHAISISAYEWNAFCTRINNFRAYKGLSSYSFTNAYKGMAISASIVNQALSAISNIPGHGRLPSQAVRGNTITASFFLTLQSALNAVS